MFDIESDAKGRLAVWLRPRAALCGTLIEVFGSHVLSGKRMIDA